MKLQFKHQQFQTDAVKAICDIFAGQPFTDSLKYMLDPGNVQQRGFEFEAFANNQLAIPRTEIWKNIHKKQNAIGIPPSTNLKNDINLTIEMETGTGKTYTYIKTMYELNKLYGWTKFIIVVPSLAIREGVKKSFEITREHFKQEYNKTIMEFVYDSKRLNEIDVFATDKNIRVMIINSQAFATSLKEDGKSKESRIIFSAQDKFKGRKPIDVLAKTNPILILDEPQSLGKTADTATQKALKLFNALFTMSFSATPPELNKNIIYRLDAQDAYSKKLVKEISVKGFSVSGNSASNGYLFLEGINTSISKSPTATIEFDYKGANTITRKRKICEEGDNLYILSGNLDQYKEYIITRIDASTESISLANGIELSIGEATGNVNENELRRIQIRGTIKSHFEREQALFNSGIKVLSLFFIDEVAKYRLSDDGSDANGEYAKIFEEEYNAIKEETLLELNANEEYIDFIKQTEADNAHKGYFSIDKKSGKFINSEVKRGSANADDIDAYDLIMKNKERLLDRAEPVRFIFSHSALREGWDNPNVFQICTLKNSANDDKRRQEIGRGLRLCVNQHGERMDENVLAGDVHNVNILTVITNESYESFVKGLQLEIASTMHDRPRLVNTALFTGKRINAIEITEVQAQEIFEELLSNGYVSKGLLTPKYHEDVANNTFNIDTSDFEAQDILTILDSVYKPLEIKNAHKSTVDIKLDTNKRDREEFQALWSKINKKSTYEVSFDSQELVKKCIEKLNTNLKVSEIIVIETTGGATTLKKDELEAGTAFAVKKSKSYTVQGLEGSRVQYDILDKLVHETGLTRLTIANILKGIHVAQFDLVKKNPEEFIMRTANIINEQKATLIIEHISYNMLEQSYDIDIFTDPKFSKAVFENTVETPHKHIYSHVLADSNSKPERDMAENLDVSDEVAVYAKLPKAFYISTPIGKYNPDWAIAFNKGQVKHVYFIAETKGTMDSLSLELRGIEKAKTECARKHFEAISSNNVKYDVVDSYASLMHIIKG